MALGALKADDNIVEFVSEACRFAGESPSKFWQGLEQIVNQFSNENEQLLAKRSRLQSQLDEYEQSGQEFDLVKYTGFLKSIGYLEAEGPDFLISVQDVDREISIVSGPQLVVPLSNPRYAVNAANSRWVSLYDSFYSSDAMNGSRPNNQELDLKRADAVVLHVGKILDLYFPLVEGSFNELTDISLTESQLIFKTKGGITTRLTSKDQFVGYNKQGNLISAVCLVHNGLHVEILIDKAHPVGKRHPVGIKDVVVEAAISTILDMEDSVAAVDSADKVLLYTNLLKMFSGTLEARFDKRGVATTRMLNADKHFHSPSDSAQTVILPGRSLLFVRIVGRHMYTSSVRTAEGKDIPECFLDAMATVLASMIDIRGLGKFRNSYTSSIYIVVPKHHGSEEIVATCKLFSTIEDIWNLPQGTVKLGVMDEERRTSLNLKECIRAAANRIVFINTGFLDRTGDEIRACTHRGVFFPKNKLKTYDWFQAYEKRNVQVALRCGLKGKGQIGKGMWPIPDQMQSMMTTKVIHPQSGASCAWVPSPTAAALHALHYHEVDVAAVQSLIMEDMGIDGLVCVEKLLDMPMAGLLDTKTVETELSNNIQSILGYVVRWIDQGIGCSKIPDLSGVGLMEDRATLRISSQLLVNWLLHNIVTIDMVEAKLRELASVVDIQNKEDENYKPLSNNFDDSIAISAARDLILKGKDQPNGYTEFILHSKRITKKLL